MAIVKTHAITLHLDHIQHLFQAPELDPFAGSAHSLSGIEQILNELQAQPLRCRVHTTILLPSTQLSKDIEQNCRIALERYCKVQIHQLSNNMASLRRQGFISLQTGLIFLAACSVLATFFATLKGLPEFPRQLLSEGFIIAGWVGLWHPADLLLYAWKPYWRDKHLYKRIRDMELEIRADR